MKDKCLILGCGPSIQELSLSKLKELSETHCIFAIKQAFNIAPELIDFHFINDNNYSRYDYSQSRAKVIAEFPKNNFVHVIAKTADKVFMIDCNESFDKSLSGSLNFDNWTIEKQPHVRPWGPGIMYELVLFYAHYLNFKEVYTYGWDLGPSKSTTRDHFYTYDVMNPAFKMEEAESNNEVSLTKHFFYWLKDNGVNLAIASSNSYAHEDIPRVTI